MGLKGWAWVIRVLRRLVLSAAIAAVVIGVAMLALFVTSWPKWLSLAIEPLSLLLTPGVVASMLFTGSHDYVVIPMLSGAYVFYLMFFYVALLGWERRVRG